MILNRLFSRLVKLIKTLFSEEVSARLAQVMVALSLVVALITFLTLTGFTPIVPSQKVVITALVLNALLVLGLSILLFRELWALHRAKRSGIAASRLHVRIVWLFTFLATVPVILVALAASLTLDRGLNQLISGVVQRTIVSSVNVSNSYFDEQIQRLRLEMSAMASELERGLYMLDWNYDEFNKLFTANVNLRGFTFGEIVTDKGNSLINMRVQRGLFVPQVNEGAIAEASKNDDIFVNIVNVGEATFLDAYVRLQKQNERFLHLSRPINPVIMRHVNDTRLGELEYQQFLASRGGIQLAFALMFSLIALIVTFSAIWVGIAFANRIIAPIQRLMGAANAVARGDLVTNVMVRPSEGDFAALGSTFNNMTKQLKGQRDELLLAQAQLDQRARFTSAVLDGVSAGVIGLDSIGRITLFNPRAAQLLGLETADFQEKEMTEIMPEIETLLQEAISSDKDIVQGQVLFKRNGAERMINVRITAEQGAPDDHGSVVTLDDMTDLVAAQRNSAWADVARRIAHEIKNPLTPIQLSAERLERKFGKHIEKDSDIFKQCTATIIRQVGDIGRMVDEFSSFARTPKPEFEVLDIQTTLHETQFLAQVGYPQVKFTFEKKMTPIFVRYDRRLISQALTNLLKNAVESIAQTSHKGLVLIILNVQDTHLKIDIVDNGIGLPKENRSRLAEPYVTTRSKGTGLGLAIVERILADHEGKLELLDRADNEQGACMRLTLPLTQQEDQKNG